MEDCDLTANREIGVCSPCVLAGIGLFTARRTTRAQRKPTPPSAVRIGRVRCLQVSVANRQRVPLIDDATAVFGPQCLSFGLSSTKRKNPVTLLVVMHRSSFEPPPTLSPLRRRGAVAAMRCSCSVHAIRGHRIHPIMSPTVLFLLATAIWGSTWLAIKFQLGSVAPSVSVSYRFALAALLLAAWCLATGRTLAFPRRAHAWIAAQGATMFGLNYILVYMAERHVASGLVAVVFATIVFMTPIGTRIAFGAPISARTAIGATLGVAGVALLFLPELRAAGDGGEPALGIAYAFAATAIAALGNLISMRMHRDGLPVLGPTAWGMAYGAVVAGLVASATGELWTLDAPSIHRVARLLSRCSQRVWLRAPLSCCARSAGTGELRRGLDAGRGDASHDPVRRLAAGRGSPRWRAARRIGN